MTADLTLQPMRWPDLSAPRQQQLLARPAADAGGELFARTRALLERVAVDGDAALRALTREFDGVEVNQFKVPPRKLAAALAGLDSDLRAALDLAIGNITRFHEAQRRPDATLETSPGVLCELVQRPLDAVGLYVPAGRAPLPSTVMMLAVPAMLAGCPRVIVCSPPGPDGEINATVLAAAALCGVEGVFRVGGAQAVAAMAYGTESIPRVAKIFGPGNQWVTAAKTLVSMDPDGAACDLPAGPSELMVIADHLADAEVVAADLLSQAEHGPDSQVVLLTDSDTLASNVAAQLLAQAPGLATWETVRESLRHAALIITESIAEAVDIANQYAPEHLIVNVDSPRRWLPAIRNAGSVFLGALAPESVGDYCSGCNHVLPTYGWARSYSGLGLRDFMRSMSVQTLSSQGLAQVGPAAVRLAQAEGLPAHARAVELRLAGPRQEAVA